MLGAYQEGYVLSFLQAMCIPESSLEWDNLSIWVEMMRNIAMFM